MEDVETLDARSPNDMDVVSFVQVPQPAHPTSADLDALDHTASKARFRVDHYVVEIDAVPRRELAFWSAYWYSMWAHRRNQAWKGFLQVDLAPGEDTSARHWLTQARPTGAHP